MYHVLIPCDTASSGLGKGSPRPSLRIKFKVPDRQAWDRGPGIRAVCWRLRRARTGTLLAGNCHSHTELSVTSPAAAARPAGGPEKPQCTSRRKVNGPGRDCEFAFPSGTIQDLRELQDINLDEEISPFVLTCTHKHRIVIMCFDMSSFTEWPSRRLTRLPVALSAETRPLSLEWGTRKNSFPILSCRFVLISAISINVLNSTAVS